jgi:hypothetical protein
MLMGTYTVAMWLASTNVSMHVRAVAVDGGLTVNVVPVVGETKQFGFVAVKVPV